MQFQMKKPTKIDLTIKVNLIIVSLNVEKRHDEPCYKVKVALNFGLISFKTSFEL
ncbi:hypothetical protein RA086_08190 [Lactiplantibacillus sp. WILCCON 0030]|uniref:Uncharacterized protein n=1 Tax=Lactiplantibacillus brownii TaxID=3069269 RepID=A0ABU1A9H5_9LACO|nr:hypothetical protein [Lactiplantibacillus brownii]MDQ7937609.1 hypothetical protein [Lactiplantibacillus brownii]